MLPAPAPTRLRLHDTYTEVRPASRKHGILRGETQAKRRLRNSPPMPETLPTVVQILSQSRAAPDVDRLRSVLERDPVTSAWVLRHINSAFYGLRQKVSSIERAVTYLGFEPVCNLVLMEVLKQTFSDVSSGRPHDVYEHLMTTSIAAAAFSKGLAEHLHLARPDTAFSAGVLHQVGRLALLSREPARYAELWTEVDGRRFLEAPPAGQEMIRFGADHVETGGQIAHAWELSNELLLPILFYKRPHQARMKQEWAYVLLVAVGHSAARSLRGGGEQPDAFVEGDFDASLTLLARLAETTPPALIAFLNEMRENVNQFVGLAFSA